jgi:phage regulator Rha-like protein
MAFFMHMMELVNLEKGTMMSSKRIAEKTGKEHSHVLRDIRSMILELEKHNPNMDSLDYQVFTNHNTGLTSEIVLNERLSLCLASGYSIQLRLMIIDDWTEMKAKLTPKTYKEALLALIQKEEEKEQLVLQVDNLSTALDSLVEWVSIIKIASKNKIKETAFDWRQLKRKSIEMGYSIKKGESPRFEFQNLYHVNVFKACYPQFNYNLLN